MWARDNESPEPPVRSSNFIRNHWKTILIVLMGLLILSIAIFLIIFLVILKPAGHTTVTPSTSIGTTKLSTLVSTTAPSTSTTFKSTKRLTTVITSTSTVPPTTSTRKATTGQSTSSTVVPSISTIGSTTVKKLSTTTKPSSKSTVPPVTTVTTVTTKRPTTPKPLPTNGPITSTAAPELSTTSPSDGCSPTTNTTFLFAYSNDLTSTLIKKALGDVKKYIVNPKITTFANNRFDTTTDDPIHFHGSKDDFDNSVNALLPDSKLKLPNTNTGSNVLNMLKKFLEQPTCGAIVYILMKRLPDTIDVTDLIQELRQNHISVFPIIDSAVIGSKDQSMMCKLAHSTNGFCDYQIASRLENEVYETMWIVSRVHVFVSQSYQVSGKGAIKVPSFVRPPQGNEQGTMGLVFTYQNHVRDTNFKALSLNIKDDQNKIVVPGKTTATNGNALLLHPTLKNNVTYQIDINYEYEKTNTVEKIEVRFYSISPPDTWIPFPTYQNVSTIRV